ncbi:hypothetical protein TH53_15325 [Pedobacter lusitanus]|uniref:RNA polymerase sigma-70 factor n=1 Tax=Pedobacter lusitanus TaxID=1503925 RepID=A0A0D0GPD1_9SPHI|nr:RNA polymerase sigma-70 factor [Pedobacter lusitanus]KIO76326.1 hypothetical protein TH53_15325 [Pedobacter lusitanus]
MLARDSYTDQELLTLLKTNGEAGLNHIYNKYWKGLYLAAFSVIRDEAQSQDIVQDVLLQLWIRKDSVEIGSLKSYLFMAVRYKVLTFIKSADHRKIFLEPDELEKLSGIDNLKDLQHENDINNSLEAGIAALPDRCREVFILSRRAYMSNKEIARQMGISVKTVEAQMTIALRQLKITMEEFFFLIGLFFYLHR